MSNNDNFINKMNPAKIYSSEVYAKTKKYQKIYGFEIGTGEHDTWNNEADAFKHTFMQADLSLKFLLGMSKYAGDKHENDGKKQGQSQNEENMDRWNNAQGREIAKEIEKEIDNFVLLKMYAHSGMTLLPKRLWRE